MFNADEVRRLKQVYSAKATEDLFRAATLERSDYPFTVMAIIDRELAKRKLSPKTKAIVLEEFRQEKAGALERLKGFGGLLPVFAALPLLNSAVLLSEGLRSLSMPAPAWSGVVAVLGFLNPMWSIGLAGYGMYVFGLLALKHEGAPRRLTEYLVCAVFLTSLSALVYSAPLSGIARLAIAVGCWLYFSESKRVAMTYGLPLPRQVKRKKAEKREMCQRQAELLIAASAEAGPVEVGYAQ